MPHSLGCPLCACLVQVEHLRSELRERGDSMSALQVGSGGLATRSEHTA